MASVSEPNAILKVVLIEDSRELLALLTEMLNEIPTVKVVASAATEQDALEVFKTTSADLAIIDLELQSGTGLNLLKNCCQPQALDHALHFLVFSNYANRVIQHRCMELGAKAFFDKSFQLEELLDFVQSRALQKRVGYST
ncbi:MAG: response regulator [Limnobacter sp.]|nr:response regulator [Limnobacter sp.]